MTDPNKPLIDERFQVVKAIGQGAMGAVYIAMDGQTNQPVALKILKKSDVAMRAKERFEREIRFLETLSHPNIVEIVHHGQDATLGLQYYAMELLFGDPISKLTEQGRTSPALALMVAKQAAEAIAVAHKHEIVHRDLKPANLMLIPQENGDVRVKILDFGLAYQMADDRLTGVGAAPGTISYMPPEQLRGDDVDERGDLYCLGVVLFEMLTGRPPFLGGSDVLIAASVLMNPAPRLDEMAGEVPAQLADLIASLLSKSPDDRPQSAAALLQTLADFKPDARLVATKVTHNGPSQNPVKDWGLSPALAQ